MKFRIYDTNKTDGIVLVSGRDDAGREVTVYMPIGMAVGLESGEISLVYLKQMHYVASAVAAGADRAGIVMPAVKAIEPQKWDIAGGPGGSLVFRSSRYRSMAP